MAKIHGNHVLQCNFKFSSLAIEYTWYLIELYSSLLPQSLWLQLCMCGVAVVRCVCIIISRIGQYQYNLITHTQALGPTNGGCMVMTYEH